MVGVVFGKELLSILVMVLVMMLVLHANIPSFFHFSSFFSFFFPSIAVLFGWGGDIAAADCGGPDSRFDRENA